MKNKSSHLMFFLILVLGMMITLSSNSWFFSWVGMEVNLMGFLPLMMNKTNKLSSEASVKYFIIQSISSALFLILCLSPKNLMNLNFLEHSLINLPLWMKLGVAPFHFWFPAVSMGLTWLNCFALMTIQKINPLILIFFSQNSFLSFFVISLTSLVGSLGGLSQSNLKKLLAYSSISHMGWIMLALLLSTKIFFIYLTIYFFSLAPLMFIFNKMNMNFIHQGTLINKPTNVSLLMNFLSIGGMPPFLGFFPKLLIIVKLMETQGLTIIAIPLILSSLINLFFYLRVTYLILMNSFSSNIYFMSKTTFHLWMIFPPMSMMILSPIII